MILRTTVHNINPKVVCAEPMNQVHGSLSRQAGYQWLAPGSHAPDILNRLHQAPANLILRTT
ncbi:MAG: hypothetical protein Kow00127_03260 [Bacteroidales bacterium]